MKKNVIFVLVLYFLCNSILWSQTLSTDTFLKLPLEEQMLLYFDTYKDGHTYHTLARFAGYMVYNYGLEVIPYLKEYMTDANFFHLAEEPLDITVNLIAYIIASLQDYADPSYNFFELDERDIQWFVDQYKNRIDEYIRITGLIDEAVRVSEWIIGTITDDEPEKYGHPRFPVYIFYSGNALKMYYEERLGMKDLKVVAPFVE
jgi:hypothetical protein